MQLMLLVLLLVVVVGASAVNPSNVVDYELMSIPGGGNWIVILLDNPATAIQSISWCKMLLSNDQSPPDLNACQSPSSITLGGVLYPSSDGVLRVRRPYNQRNKLIINPRHVSWDANHQMEIVIELAVSGGPQERVSLMRQVARLNAPSKRPLQTTVQSIPHQKPPAEAPPTESTAEKPTTYHWMGVVVIFSVGLPCIAVVAMFLYGGKTWTELAHAARRRISYGVPYYFQRNGETNEIDPEQRVNENKSILESLGTDASFDRVY